VNLGAPAGYKLYNLITAGGDFHPALRIAKCSNSNVIISILNISVYARLTSLAHANVGL